MFTSFGCFQSPHFNPGKALDGPLETLKIDAYVSHITFAITNSIDDILQTTVPFKGTSIKISRLSFSECNNVLSFDRYQYPKWRSTQSKGSNSSGSHFVTCLECSNNFRKSCRRLGKSIKVILDRSLSINGNSQWSWTCFCLKVCYDT